MTVLTQLIDAHVEQEELDAPEQEDHVPPASRALAKPGSRCSNWT